MSNSAENLHSVEDAFEDGVASSECGDLPEKLLTADEMAQALFVAGKISGAALWLTDNIGRQNAEAALQTAFQMIQGHCAHRREKGN
jgi:hypothetical protein